MNLISHVQSMLRLQLKIHIVRSSCFMDYRDRDVRITGSHLCEWYMDKQSLVPKTFVFQSYFLLHTRNVLHHCLKNNQKSINASLLSFVTSPKAIRLKGK